MAVYYVATGGSDKTGTGGADAPFASINRALKAKVQAGDEIVVKAGTYHEQVAVTKGGDAKAMITIRADIAGTVKIEPPADKDYGFVVLKNYVKIDGFEIAGASKAGITANLVHHVEITNNVVHGSLGNGISVSRSDFVLIEGNTTYENASVGARSGISVFHSENVSGDSTTTGYRIIVRNNVSYDNVTKSGAHTDGNGIIIDSNSSKNGSYAEYTCPVLVENNVVYGNGGSGIMTAWSDNVTVVNNTAYHNNVDPLATGTWKGEFTNMNSSGNTWANNVAVADGSRDYHTGLANVSFKSDINENVTWVNNLSFNGVAGAASVMASSGNSKPSAANGNLLGVDPGINPSKGFQISKSSAAVDAGVSLPGTSSTDKVGTARLEGIDLGAYEVGSRSGTPDDTGGVDSGTGGGTGSRVGTAGNDVLVGDEFANNLKGLDGNDTIRGGLGDDTLFGGAGQDVLRGDGGNDSLQGGTGADELRGGEGNDLLVGGLGGDVLIGGLGSDRFVFATSVEARGDVIGDFWRSQGDKIDLSGIDANSRSAGNQKFDFIGEKEFGGVAGQLHYKDGVLAGDTNGDKVADFQIAMAHGQWLGGADFIL